MIHVEDETFCGGDAGYFYHGKLNTGADNILTASIILQQHDPRIPSVFGPVARLELTMKGKYSEPHYELAGTVNGIPIQATGSFLLPLPQS